MRLLFKRNVIFGYIIAWSIIGFPLLALVTTALGVPTTILSIIFRTFAALGALFLTFLKVQPTNRAVTFLFLAFWVVYFSRLTFTTAFDPSSLTRPLSYYWIWSFGTCFLPALSIVLTFEPEVKDRLGFPLLLLVVIALFLAVVFGGTSVRGGGDSIVEIGRLNIDSLNPISMGHLGVTGVLIGICAFLSGQLRSSMLPLAIIAMLFGGATTILANSRGPLLAMAACLAILIFAGVRRRRTYAFGVLFVVLLVLIAVNQQEAIYGGDGVLWRFQAYFLGVDQSSNLRVIAFEGAVTQFLESPIWGDAIEERITGFYPHNVVLEAFMATGIAGGVPFTVLLLGTIGRAWVLVRQGSKQMWIGILAVQYITAGLFSGAIYSSNTMWVLVALTLSLPLNHPNILQTPTRRI